MPTLPFVEPCDKIIISAQGSLKHNRHIMLKLKRLRNE